MRFPNLHLPPGTESFTSVTGRFESRHEAGTALASHRHALPYVAIVIDGAYFESSADGVYWCEPGSLIVHPPLHLHTNRFGERRVRVLNLTLPPSAFRSPPSHFAVARLPLRLCTMLLHSPHLPEVGELLSECEPVVAESRATITESAAAILRSNPLAKVGAIARLLGVSREHLSREFSAYYGMSLSQFRGERRLRNALNLLASDPRSLTRIALDAGFADHAHMARSVSAAVGRPPSAIRRWLLS
ncbi:MAG TPA: helix-turn-helix transcriptional regulator [Gemmatimonadaceae bacterium]|nr:helix-turn-helix transcriptional regulator [Gemmatimonadaceae bacterium]